MGKKKKAWANVSSVQNSAKTLLANIRLMSPDSPVRTMVITSSVPSEGKTFTSVELARAIATSGKTILLVEADMRRRSLAKKLNVHASAGAYSVLTGAVPLSQAITSTSVPNMYFLDIEPNIPNPVDIISSKRYSKLMDSLESTYDYVIYDTPPVGTFIDAALLSALVDGTIMVVRSSFVKRTELLAAWEQLQKPGITVLGVCMTFCESNEQDYYKYYYTQDGGRVRKAKGAQDMTALQLKKPQASLRRSKDLAYNRPDSHKEKTFSPEPRHPASGTFSGKGRSAR